MKIRSVTCFYHPGMPETKKSLDKITKLSKHAVSVFSDEGYEVQTVRLATVPFPYYMPVNRVDEALAMAKSIEQAAGERDFEFVSIGPALTSMPESYALIPEVLKVTQSLFMSGEMAGLRTGINTAAVHACARVIHEVAPYSPDGFANLRFAALANVGPFVPFFPSSYHEGIQPAFALAIECADVANLAFQNDVDLNAGRKKILDELNAHGATLTRLSQEIQNQFAASFQGIDFSLAPFPGDLCSLGGAIEQIGVSRVGLAGSLAAAAFLADTLDLGEWPRVGFNGLMMPVLEDSTLAKRSADGSLTINDLLLYSAVCGCGLDTVPLPGDVTQDQLEALLMDVASLAVRLNKPLTARLMPVPNKKAGDLTEYDFEYFENGGVMALPSENVAGALKNTSLYSLRPRR